jgi:CheY-like chemotaxis protein
LGASLCQTSGTVKILIVEDDHEIRAAIQEILIQEGYDAPVVSDGKAALEHLHNESAPCLILLDLRMPFMDGQTFLEARSSFGLAPDAAVVILTASQPVHLPEGISGVLTKPFRIDQLLEVARKHCEGGAAHQVQVIEE